MPTPLQQNFFEHSTLTVARLLLNCLLCKVDNHGKLQLFRIVETEAYTQDDPACHAYQKTSGRASIFYGKPGTAYVYFIYGMHYCFNVVTEPEGTAGAVLFRALEPLTKDYPVARTDGPARLTKALGITKENTNHTHLILPKSRMKKTKDFSLYLAQGEELDSSQILQTERIGISKAKERPWRFLIRNNPYVSKSPKTH